MKMLENNLGKALRAEEVAKYLGVNVKTVRDNYRELGGIRFGRQYRFFEKEICDAVSKRQEMDSTSEESEPGEGAQEGKSVLDQEGSQGLGSQDAEKACRGMGQEDRHGLLK